MYWAHHRNCIAITLLFFLLNIDCFGQSVASYKTIKLSNYPSLGFQRNFYVQEVQDLRIDTSMVGITHIGFRGAVPLRFPSSTKEYLQRWLNFIVPPQSNLQPVTLQVLTLHSHEVQGAIGQKAICNLTIRILTQDSGMWYDRGTYEVEEKHSDLDVSALHSYAIAEAFTAAFRELEAQGWPETRLGSSIYVTRESNQYPWAMYRATHPDSLPDGVYNNIVGFRTGAPLKGIPYTVSPPNEPAGTLMQLVYTAGSMKGKPMPRGKFAVFDKTRYIRFGSDFLPLRQDRNGFYVLAYRVESSKPPTGLIAASFIVGGLLGAAITSAAIQGSGTYVTISPVQKPGSIMIRLNLDMRTGELVDQSEWKAHLNTIEDRLPARAVVFSPKRSVAATTIMLVSGSDTLQAHLDGNSHQVLTLARPFEVYKVLAKGMYTVEFQAMAGYNYIKVFEKDDELQFDILNPKEGAFESAVVEPGQQ